MKKLIQRLAVFFTTTCTGLFYISNRVYADIIVPEPEPEPTPPSGIVLIIAGLLVICVVVASIVILKKIKK